MNAVRLLIAVFWLLMSGMGGAAMAVPAVYEAHPMACHQEQGQSSSADSGLQHQAMPCCAHALGVPLPLFPVLNLISAPLQHRIEQQSEPRGHSPYLEPDPPRNV